MGRHSRFRVALALSIGALAWATLSAPPAGAATTAGGPISKLLGPARPQPAAGRAKPNVDGVGPRADFNGDGFGDLAVGVPGEDIGSISNAGGVNVLYGSSSGLAAAGNQFWSQNSKGVIGVAETNDAFGTVVATGDFNNDGYSDLAIGVPDESVGSAADAGGVNVLYGSPSGLVSAGNQFWSQNSSGILDSSETGDEFGSSLAARDFNGDGYTDLAIGVPHEANGSATDEGAVNVIYGSAAGLVSTGNQLFRGPHAGDLFGSALAAGNFNGSGGVDLAVGAPGTTVSGVKGAGSVFTMSGGGGGLGIGVASANYENVKGAACGLALAAGDFDADGSEDLAAGCPHEKVGSKADVGGFDVHFGSPGGLLDASLSYVGVQAAGEYGSSLASAGLGTAPSGDTIAVGIPLYDDPGAPDGGFVDVLGIARNGQILGEQPIAGDEGGGLFGAALTTGNFDGDGWADLAAGEPGDEVGSSPGAGSVGVYYGSPSGLAGAPQWWSQNSKGLSGTAEPEDFFGDALSGRNE
jgi:hypothetical protein